MNDNLLTVVTSVHPALRSLTNADPPEKSRRPNITVFSLYRSSYQERIAEYGKYFQDGIK